MAAGIPVLATAVCGTPELVDSSCGRLLPADLDAETLAAAIDDVWKDRFGWMERGRNARMRAEMLCDASENYRRFAASLIQLAQESAGAG